MQISMLMRSPKVKRSQNSGTSENLTVAPKIACQTMDLLILTFIMHGNGKNDASDCFDMHLRPFNV